MESDYDLVERLLTRLELAYFQIENNDPDVRWVRNG